MQAEYKRDTHNSYLVLYDTEEQREESFRTRMFLENDVPGFLSCRMYEIDCIGKFFYDISSRQSLAVMLETKPLDRTCLEGLLTSILKALSGLQSYMLDTDGFCLKAEWIFCSPSGQDFAFCYYPGGGFSWKEQLRQLSEYLLTRLDHKSRAAVLLGYDFYQSAAEEKISASDLEELLLKKTEDQDITGRRKGEKRKQDPADGEGKETETADAVPASREELLNSFFDQEEEEKTEKSGTIRIADRIPGGFLPVLELGVPSAAGVVLAVLLWFFGYDIPAVGSAVFSAAAVVFLLFRRRKKAGEKERDAAMEQYVMVQDWLEEEKEEERLLQEKTAVEAETRLPEEDNATCLLTSEAAYSKLARGYLIPDAGQGGSAVAVDQEMTMIGKSSQMDVILKGNGISRIHARIFCRGEDCFLSDLNSRNGTRVNGVLLKPEEEQLLKDGDRISFANTGFEWRCYRL